MGTHTRQIINFRLFTSVSSFSKDVRLPVQLQRAMAAEAEAAREARAKVIAAEGEQKASHALKEAAKVIQESPSALQVSGAFENHYRQDCLRSIFRTFARALVTAVHFNDIDITHIKRKSFLL